MAGRLQRLLPLVKFNHLKTFLVCALILFVALLMYMRMTVSSSSVPGPAGSWRLDINRDVITDYVPSMFRMNNRTYHGIDLMTLPIYQFDPRYKNPCWRNVSELRCLPYFFIIAVMKCGTTQVHNYIYKHHDYARPTFGKEALWFSRVRFDSRSYDNMDFYINMFKKAANRIEESARRKGDYSRITGDGSPPNIYKNLHWRYLPGNEDLDEPKYVILDYIHHFLPKAKIIVIFRDPVDRLYSEYSHRLGVRRDINIANPEHFHELVVKGINLYEKCIGARTIRACVYDERINEELLGVHMQLGFYHVYWKELTRLFPREQILVLQNKDLKYDKTMRNTLFTFLDMRPLSDLSNLRVTKRHSNARRSEDVSQGDMLNETRRLLVDFYKPHNEEMYRIMGDKAFLYSEN